MAYVDWAESMSVGNEAIDHDHQVIVGLINKLHDEFRADMAQSLLANTLKVLVDYTVHHFDREEQVMTAGHYPELEQHHAVHEHLKSQVSEILQRFENDGEAVVKDDLLEFLKSWLINHILKEDMAFRPYVENNAQVENLTTELLHQGYAPRV